MVYYNNNWLNTTFILLNNSTIMVEYNNNYNG